MLKPQGNVQRFIISSPAVFNGEYTSDNINISIMFDNHGMIRDNQQSNYYMVSIKTGNNESQNGFVLKCSSYDYYRDNICMCLSILYGKMFYNHGFIERNSGFWKPDFSTLSFYNYNADIYSNKPRKDLEIPLHFEEFCRIAKVLESEEKTKQYGAFFNAARFYWRALRNMEKEPELAFIDLISCGEALSGGYDYTDDELTKNDYDWHRIKKMINDCGFELKARDKLYKFIKNRMFNVKRKYVLTIVNSLNDYFFTHSECIENGKIGCIQQDTVEDNIKKTYDLRSKYVHEGLQISKYIRALSNWQNEVEILQSLNNEEKISQDIFTLHGLERVMRYCLLVYIHNKLNVKIDDKLDIISC